MNLKLREVLRFGLWFLPLFLVFVLLYPVLLPPYQDGVLLVSNGALQRLSPRAHVEAQAIEGQRWSYFQRSLVFSVEGRPKQVRWNPLQIHLLFLSLALLPALIGSTPVPFPKRLQMLGLGLGLLFIAHVLTMIALPHCYACLGNNPDSFPCTLLRSFLYSSGQVVPVVLWSLLAWPHLFPRSERVARVHVEGKLSRNAPCPCGSGRKYKRCCGRAAG